MSMSIRHIEERDHGTWERLFKAYIVFYRASVPDEVVAMTWRRLLEGPPEGFLGLVAVDGDDQPVGIAHVLFHKSTWSATGYCYLEDLYVDPAARGAGVGRRLIEAVYAAADRCGATRTYWTTQEFNYRARALYDTVATRTPFIRYQR